MTRTTFAVSTAGILLVAFWVQAPAGPAGQGSAESRQAAAAEAARAAESAEPAARRLDDQAARLRDALASVRPFATPARNPFAYHRDAAPERRAPASPLPQATPAAANPSSPPAVPVVRYPSIVALIAETQPGGAPRRAMLEFDGESAIVQAGDTFARFVVRAIGETSVELVDVSVPARPSITLSIR